MLGDEEGGGVAEAEMLRDGDEEVDGDVETAMLCDGEEDPLALGLDEILGSRELGVTKILGDIDRELDGRLVVDDGGIILCSNVLGEGVADDAEAGVGETLLLGVGDRIGEGAAVEGVTAKHRHCSRGLENSIL